MIRLVAVVLVIYLGAMFAASSYLSAMSGAQTVAAQSSKP